MITLIQVENLATIDRVEIRLGSGLTALTGETGAGKSLMIDAVELALGGRADSDLVRSGTQRARVQVEFDLTNRPQVQMRLKESAVDLDDGRLEIVREVSAQGKSQAKINGRPVSAGILRQIGSWLIDLYGQHDHQSLLDPDRHIGFLDEWGGEELLHLRQHVGNHFQRMRLARARLNAIRDGKREMEQKLDLLRFQINDIEKVAPLPGEMAELEDRRDKLRHAERLREITEFVLETTVDGEGSAIEKLGESLRQLESGSQFDATLSTFADGIRPALYAVEETIRDVRGYLEAFEMDPQALDDIESRIERLRRLRKKYGDDEAAVLQFLARAQEELNHYDIAGADEEQLAADLEEAEHRYEAQAQKLSELRKEKAEVFCALVQETLALLAMDRAVFEVSFQKGEASENGDDRAEFFLSANVGETPKPLARIASGGELSRVMLAIKSAFAGRTGVPTLIFDEADAGLSGRAAAAVARQLRTLANHDQVVFISHLPQIASVADHHFHIDKTEANGRVHTMVRRLDHEQRVTELARMLAGDTVTDAALANARDLLGVP